jgi:hypothetical protein
LRVNQRLGKLPLKPSRDSAREKDVTIERKNRKERKGKNSLHFAAFAAFAFNGCTQAENVTVSYTFPASKHGERNPQAVRWVFLAA